MAACQAYTVVPARGGCRRILAVAIAGGANFRDSAAANSGHQAPVLASHSEPPTSSRNEGNQTSTIRSRVREQSHVLFNILLIYS